MRNPSNKCKILYTKSNVWSKKKNRCMLIQKPNLPIQVKMVPCDKRPSSGPKVGNCSLVVLWLGSGENGVAVWNSSLLKNLVQLGNKEVKSLFELSNPLYMRGEGGTYHGNNNNKFIPVLLILKLYCNAVTPILLLELSRNKKIKLKLDLDVQTNNVSL